MKKIVRVVYAGKTFDGKSTLVHRFFINGDTKREALFKKLKGYHCVGTTYDIEQTNKTTFVFPHLGLPESQKQIKIKDEMIEEWRTLSELDRAKMQLLKARSKINNSPEVLRALNPVAKLYFEARSSTERLAIELAITHHLRTWFPEKDGK